jgi:adenylate kinase
MASLGTLIVLMGPTGAGKSSQGDLLAKELGGVHFSSGALLREDPKAAAMLVSGHLAPAEEVERVVGEAIDAVPREQPIILDGFPRTMSNVHWLDSELPKHNRVLRRVVLIELDIETSLQRLGLRDRADDAPAAIREKYRIFEEKTMHVVEHYEQQGLLARVDGRGTREQVQALIKAVLA